MRDITKIIKNIVAKEPTPDERYQIPSQTKSDGISIC